MRVLFGGDAQTFEILALGRTTADDLIQASPVRYARGSPIEKTGGLCSPQDACAVM